MNERLEISNHELVRLDNDDYRVQKCNTDWYFLQLLKKANELGLKGKKIKGIYSIEENFVDNRIYIDFVLEDKWVR